MLDKTRIMARDAEFYHSSGRCNLTARSGGSLRISFSRAIPRNRQNHVRLIVSTVLPQLPLSEPVQYRDLYFFGVSDSLAQMLEYSFS